MKLLVILISLTSLGCNRPCESRNVGQILPLVKGRSISQSGPDEFLYFKCIATLNGYEWVRVNKE